MRILSLKPGHDGAVAYIDDGHLVFSLEAEKDSFERYRELTPSLVAQAAELAPAPPDVVAISGWHKYLPGYESRIGAGYQGTDGIEVGTGSFFGSPVRTFSSTHERSHLFCAAGLAPGAPLERCVILVWEGGTGAFVEWSEYGAVLTRRAVLSQPGARYSALFALADPTFPDQGRIPRIEDAGKLMALAGFGDADAATGPERAAVERILDPDETMYTFDKGSYRDSPLYNSGVTSEQCKRAAQYLSDRLFAIFHDVAAADGPRDVPLLIAGGCGLNCEWNRRWRESGLFSEVFVPPCTNDSGSAIGTAVDAAQYFGGPCKISWSVYAGADFRHDAPVDGRLWSTQPYDAVELALALEAGRVVAWVQGRYEIGPRALGHRSLLASPLQAGSRDRLNAIKQRADYRPIAPVCLAGQLGRWFDPPIDDPYMLYFSRVRTDALPAVTHVDGTARVQSVREAELPELSGLLGAFSARTGYGVLCNTSLNYLGHGFINSMSELLGYCSSVGVDDIVVDGVWHRRLRP